MGLCESILANLIQQNPPESFIAACNAYNDWINSNVIMESTCFINNQDCNNDSENNNKAIDSHLISKGSNLKPISKNGKVRTIGISHKNPMNNVLNETAIKKATTFPGFCKYHDNLLFRPIESTKINDYTKEHVLLLCFRAAVHKRYQAKKEYKKTSLIMQSFNNKIVKNMLKENIIQELRVSCAQRNKSISKFRVAWHFIKTNFVFTYGVKKKNKLMSEDYIALNQLSKILMGFIQEQDYSEIVFKKYTSVERKIAFSSVYYVPLKKFDTFVFLFVLPNDETSNIIIACLQKDFDLLMNDNIIKQCFEGNIDKIQDLINFDSESIVFNGDDFSDYDYVKYIYESNHPIKRLFPPYILK